MDIEFEIEELADTSVILDLPLREDLNIEIGNGEVIKYGNEEISNNNGNFSLLLKDTILKLSSVDNIKPNGCRLFIDFCLFDIDNYQILLKYGIYGIIVYIQNKQMLLSVISRSGIILKKSILDNLEKDKWYYNIEIKLPDISNLLIEDLDRYFYFSDFNNGFNGAVRNIIIKKD
jgi:hypothetical protein